LNESSFHFALRDSGGAFDALKWRGRARIRSSDLAPISPNLLRGVLELRLNVTPS
jgi:hypothetical protein